MIDIHFSGTNIENLVRQIQAFVEKVELKEGEKRGRKKTKDYQAAGADSFHMGEEQR